MNIKYLPVVQQEEERMEIIKAYIHKEAQEFETESPYHFCSYKDAVYLLLEFWEHIEEINKDGT